VRTPDEWQFARRVPATSEPATEIRRAIPVDANPKPLPEYFTVGNTKDDVLSIQGSPDFFTDGEFKYGSSTVYFQNNRVTSWSIYYPRLKARLLPDSQH
jgi:hypothetical protein